MAYQTVGQLKINQQGGYVCCTEFVYIHSKGILQHSTQTSNELLGQSYTTDPADLGVPNDSILWMKIWVMAGTDNQASQAFMYQQGSPVVAEYTCSGPTLNHHLAPDDVK